MDKTILIIAAIAAILFLPLFRKPKVATQSAPPRKGADIWDAVQGLGRKLGMIKEDQGQETGSGAVFGGRPGGGSNRPPELKKEAPKKEAPRASGDIQIDSDLD